MKLIKSKQRDIRFSFCPSPVTIDKSSEWGEGNVQKFPNGVYLKHDEESNEITHGVQPCSDVPDRPEGWIKQPNGLFQKKDIFLIRELEVGTTKTIETLDGIMQYEVKVPASLVCQNKDGIPNEADSWIIDNNKLSKLYELN